MFKKGLVDFHFHSCFSDGSESIGSIISEAKKLGMTGLCLTDHNNCGGVAEFVSMCTENDIVAFEGTEIYLNFPQEDWSKQGCGQMPDAVIMGRRLDWKKFLDYQLRLKEYWRDYWLPQTMEGLRSVGLKVSEMTKKDRESQVWDEKKGMMIPKVLHEVPKNPDNWQALLDVVHWKNPDVTLEEISKSPVSFANGHLYNLGMPAYVLRVFPDWSVEEAVCLADEMSGVLFVAHPGGDRAPWTKAHLEYFVQNGGMGIEVWQYWHKEEQINHFLQFAMRHNMLVSGGSDWHGTNDVAPTLGASIDSELQTPNWVTEHLFARLP